ncbi:hypothetical protein BGZ59_011020 [Podila verticillata]|nr:hypothetical protein BGZ59_011020 [Podila verticillata]KFH67087.1 hypothetical protein MVEG_07610 [Podila verticillata NRRL 6337]
MDKKASSDPKKTLKTVFGNSPDQHILNVVKESCQEAFNLPSFTTTLQTIKSHFFDRNYDAVFQNPAHLPVYSARYAPSRALCYYHLFLEHPILMKTLEGPSTILCIGSGAGSELVGISAAMVHANPVPKTKKKKATTSSSGKSKDREDKEDKKDEEAIPKEAPIQTEDPALNLEKMNISSPSSEGAAPEEVSVVATKPKKSKANKHQVTIVMQDYVDWTSILKPMETVVRQRMVLGAERLVCETEVGNVLDLSEGLLQRVAKADLITFMFVLNELFQDKKRTMLLVAKIVAAMPTGAHMLVVDSAGSFSNLKVGERTYMVYMLLDHLKSLETVYQDDATWYRCPPSATYPLKLENMRHFVRIYRKL